MSRYVYKVSLVGREALWIISSSLKDKFLQGFISAESFHQLSKTINNKDEQDVIHFIMDNETKDVEMWKNYTFLIEEI